MLQELCIEAAASADFWRVQSRHLQVLREEHVNALVDLLIKPGRLPPTSLYNFSTLPLTELTIRRQRIQTLKRWIPCIAASLPYLRSLTLSSKEIVFWQPLPSLSALAPTLQSLTLEGISGYGMSSSITNTLKNTISSLTSLTELKLAGFENDSQNSLYDATLDFKHLEPLSLLENLQVHFIHLGEPENLSSLIHLISLKSISFKPPNTGRQFEYAPGILYLGSLPNLEHFEFIGTSSCPPVATTLTSLVWEMDSSTNISHRRIPENAELAWIEMKPKLERLREFRFVSMGYYGEPNEISTIVADVILGAAAKSLTSLFLMPQSLPNDTSFLSQCTNLKTLTLLGMPPHSKYDPISSRYAEMIILHLPCLTNLTHLTLDVVTVGEAHREAMKSIQYLTNLEKLEFNPGYLVCIADLALGGVLTKLKYLSICARGKKGTYGENITYFWHKLVPTDDLELLAQFILPSLTTLKLEHYIGAPELWRCLGSLAPKVEYLSVDGYLHQYNKTPITLKDLRWVGREAVDWSVCCASQVQSMVEAFPNLKRLEIAKRYVLGAPHFFKARTTREHSFDIDLEELKKPTNEEEKWMKTVDVQYLEPLSAEVLRLDERYRYSEDEMEALGEQWKNSAQGKNEMINLREKLADGLLVV
ncbi:hypothetical protein Ndes2526A_g01992 [Nannochloris sp. 'desiccata']